MDLNGKRALVTGGAVRIGRAISEALADAGAEVIVHFRSSEKAAKALGPNVIQADLDDPAQCENLIQKASERFGPLDILVNNAAVFHQCSLRESTQEAVLKELQPNLFAPLTLIREFAKQKRPGKIINLLDRRITSHDTAYVPYMLSKKSLEELTKLAALELAPETTVNAIAPGAVLPPPDKKDDTTWEPAGVIPLDKRPAPKDIANAVVYLLETDIITGQTLFIDGGQHLTG
ncbi:SDR family oxidoreductase [Tichowtungia aerotolerans]|uniref:SDR family oxidoreductase n=1 Tax=Tichowtungia aerotolerans TaxID=2697043 RepID=A0A6P1M262_9BACT|nr:SDR family oxidoreductase [Tichowtungia aerotolerans]QHI68202.1 SDR family oxidoreductase [Tichowtungia aerotolerans]